MATAWIALARLQMTFPGSPPACCKNSAWTPATFGIQDVPFVGGKNASLGEMIQQLSPQGVRVPTGFATTANAYAYFIRAGGLEEKMRSHLDSLDTEDIEALRKSGQSVRDLILETPFPPELERAIESAYLDLCDRNNPNLDVAVRSSATAEDLFLNWHRQTVKQGDNRRVATA